MSYLAMAKAALSRLRASGADPETVARLLAMSLDVFAAEGRPLELRVPWWPDTLFLVPDVRHAEALWLEGIGRERVWTASEMSSLSSTALTAEEWRVLTIVKRKFEGEVVEVRPQG